MDYQQQYSAPQYTENTSVVSHSYTQQAGPVHYERENSYVMVQGSWQQQEVTNDATCYTESDDLQAAPQNTVVEEDMMSVHAMSPSPSMMEVCVQVFLRAVLNDESDFILIYLPM